MLRSDILESGKQSVFMERLVNRIEFLVEDIRDDPNMTGWRQMSGDNISSLDPTLVPEDILRRRARAAYLKDPYGRGIIRTLVKFIIGSGFLIDFTEEDKKKKKLILKWWRTVKKKVKWTRFIRELVTRAFRDGEVFVWRFAPSSDGDIISQIRFIDPDDVKDINTAKTDVETVESYTLKISNEEKTIPANEIAHLKINVDSNVKRGRSVLESMLPLFTKHGKWLEARMLLNIVRTSIALVQQVEGPSTDLFRLRGAQASNRSGGQQDTAKMVRPGTILRGTPGVKYQMLSPNLDAKDAAEDGKHILLAVASAAGLPDVMVTCDYEGSNFACHSIDVYILTSRGWKQPYDLDPDEKFATVNMETGLLEYQQSTHRHLSHYVGDMYEFNGRRMDFCVTPNHTMLVTPYHAGHRRKESIRKYPRPLSDFSKVEIADLSKSLYLVPASAQWEGEDKPLYYLPDGTSIEMDIWLEFLGYVITEGCITYSTRNAVQITQQTPDKIPIIEACLQQLPWEYTTTISNDAHVFRIWNAPLKEHLISLIGTVEGAYSHQKRLPDFIWELSPFYLQSLFDALILGDGKVDVRPGRMFYIYQTISPQLADDVQRLAILLGLTANMSDREQPGKEGKPTLCYSVNIANGHPQLLETANIKQVPYDGMVWCATVPNGNLITRRNGKPCISGNSTVVAQNPAIREFEDWQSFFSEFFAEIIAWFMEDGVQCNWTVEEENVDFDIAFPPILSRDIGQETSAYHLMYTDGAISLRTYRLSSGFNPDTEEEQVDIEGGPPIQKQPQLGAPQQKLVPKGVEDRNPRQNVKAGTESSVQEEIQKPKQKKPKVVIVNVKGHGKLVKPLTLEYSTPEETGDIDASSNTEHHSQEA